jgi:hypothetical protein
MKRAAARKHIMALFHIALVIKHIATPGKARERSVYNYFRGRGKLEYYYRFIVDKEWKSSYINTRAMTRYADTPMTIFKEIPWRDS